jgi:formiminotetrahydrofolate cyclodeaminase
MDIVREVASTSPVPAGGAAAAYTLCLAISLIYKTILFELNSGRITSELEKNILTVKKELERLLQETETLVEKDSKFYREFSASKKGPNAVRTKRHFQKTIDVSMRVVESGGAAFGWIRQIHPVISTRMMTHLRVASDLIMGAINGTIHVATDNIQAIRVAKKRDNYLLRLQELQKEYKQRYEELSEKLAVQKRSTQNGYLRY